MLAAILPRFSHSVRVDVSAHIFGALDGEEFFANITVSLGTIAVFKWKGKSCSDNEAHLCCLGHGDILVMDGQCQDEFLHCTDPCSEQERINVTFRWVKQHVPSCSFLRGLFGFSLMPCAHGRGSTGLASLPPFVYRAWVAEMCLLLDTPLGRRSVEALSL